MPLGAVPDAGHGNFRNGHGSGWMLCAPHHPLHAAHPFPPMLRAPGGRASSVRLKIQGKALLNFLNA